MFNRDNSFDSTNPFNLPEDDLLVEEKKQQVRAYRDISTDRLPQELKNQLKPHWSDWILASPEYARYHSHGDKVQIFVRRKNRLVPAKTFNDIELGQEHYVLRRRPVDPNRIAGGGGSGHPSEPEKKYSSNEDALLSPESISIRDPNSQSRLFVGKDKRLSEAPDGTLTLVVSGDVTQSSSVRTAWSNETSGADNPQKINGAPVAVSRGDKIPWQAKISGISSGSCVIVAKTPGGKTDYSPIEIVPRQIQIAELLYQPDQNAFFLILSDDYPAFTAAAEQQEASVAQLSQAYSTNDQAQLDQAKAAVDQKLKPLVDGKVSRSDLVEIVGLRGKKTYYVEKNDLQSGWRKYAPVRGGAEALELVNNSNSFDFETLKKKFDPRTYEKTLNTEYKWDLIEPTSHSINSWAESMNRRLSDILSNQEDLPEDRRFDYSAEAQVMRYSYGTSLVSNFNLKERQIGLNFDSETSFTAAAGKISGNWYIPNAEGVEVIFTDVPSRGSRAGQTIECNIGSFRFKASAELSGFAGASLQASAGLTFGMEDGKPKVRGSVKNSDNEKENYVGIGGEAFAGIKGTGALTGSGEWKNPEKGHDWVSLLDLGVSATIAGGLSLKGDFGIDYQDGRFVIHFSGQLVCVAGGGGNFACTVGVKHIKNFIIYLFHELKNEDFHHVGVITNEAFDMYVAYSTYGLVTGEDLRDIYGKGYRTAYKIYQPVKNKFKELQSYVEEQEALAELHQQQKREINKQKIKEIREEIKVKEQRMEDAKALAKRILANRNHLACQPPETKGQLLYSLTPMSWKESEETQEEAIIIILKTAQSWNDYVEIVSHCSEGGVKIPLEQGEERLRHILDGRDHDRFELLRLQLKRLNRQPQINTAAIIDNGLSLPV